MSILDEFYQRMIKICIKENRKLKQPNLDYSKTYYNTNIIFGEDRKLNIRWIKLPTFTRENKTYYYVVFVNDIDYWRSGEKKQLYRQIRETLDCHDVDSYTIFQFGRYHGHVDQIINDLMKYYHIYVFNTQNPTLEDTETIYKFIANFVQKRIDSIKKDGIVFGSIEKDIRRLQSFVDFLNSIYSFNVISNSKKNSFNISYNYKNRRGKYE